MCRSLCGLLKQTGTISYEPSIATLRQALNTGVQHVADSTLHSPVQVDAAVPVLVLPSMSTTVLWLLLLLLLLMAALGIWQPEVAAELLAAASTAAAAILLSAADAAVLCTAAAMLQAAVLEAPIQL